MASIIRVKRSTGATAPSSLNFGELGLTIGAGTQANKVKDYLSVTTQVMWMSLVVDISQT